MSALIHPREALALIAASLIVVVFGAVIGLLRHLHSVRRSAQDQGVGW